MGLFDIFKSKTETKQIGTFNCLSLAGKWDTGYKTDTKGLVKFIKKNIKDGTLEKVLDYKFVDEKVNDTMNKVKTPTQGNIYIPSNLINSEFPSTRGFKIIENNLIILNIDNDQNYWAKKIDYQGDIRSISFQFVELDEDEYKLLKPFEKKIMKKSESLVKTWGNLYNVIYKGLFETEKRKKYPINSFMSFLGFEEV